MHLDDTDWTKSEPTTRSGSGGCRPKNLALVSLQIAGAMAAALSVSTTADAGVEITTHTRHMASDGAPAGERGGKIWIEGSKLRMEVNASTTSDETANVLFHGDRDVLWILDPSRKTYVRLDEELVTALSDRLAQARSELEARMEGATPEERALLEQMMARVAPPPVEGQDDYEIVPTEERKEIEGIPVERIDLRQKGARIGEIWIANWDDTGVNREELEAFREFAGFQQKLTVSLGPSVRGRLGSVGFDIFQKLDGFPLVVRRFDSVELQSETRFSGILPHSAKPGFFEVPSGYTEVETRGRGAAPTRSPH